MVNKVLIALEQELEQIALEMLRSEGRCVLTRFTKRCAIISIAYNEDKTLFAGSSHN